MVFQSTRPRGARPRGVTDHDLLNAFQSTRPRGARPNLGYAYDETSKFQSTRPRGARPGNCTAIPSLVAVSIHAPAWGATRNTHDVQKYPVFQSTRPRGARHQEESKCRRQTKRFNPRARVGRDNTNACASTIGTSFQSTRPRGARRKYFSNYCSSSLVSIHAPAWGATERLIPDCQLSDVSIHAPAWGATSHGTEATRRGICFNPRARVGRDPLAKPMPPNYM